jgi:acyl-CoA synthetase (AMP-forming)/AMP-acid ligase II/thioesterase domain-containing protein/NADP-dependent 3-hydroxy acid dehydrogenase YdfG/acyl carrier protein
MLQNQKLVAYIVANKTFSKISLQDQLKSKLAGYMRPHAYILVSSLPLTVAGYVDEGVLASIRAIDSDLVEILEKHISSNSEIEQVAILVEPQVKAALPIHLEKLLPSTQQFAINQTLTSIKSESVIHDAYNTLPIDINQPAISHGKSLPVLRGIPQNLGRMLQQTAHQHPNQGIIYIQSDGTERFQSYEALLETAKSILAGLKKSGLQPGDKVIFQLEQNQDFIDAFWGCILGGFIPVPIGIVTNHDRTSIAFDKLNNCYQILKHPLILTDNKLEPNICKWAKDSNLNNFHVESIERIRDFKPESNLFDSRPEDLAILLLTSGSTGIPKAVKQSHASLVSNCASTTEMNGFSAADISVNWFPLDHVVGLVFSHLRDVYLGCQQIHIPTQEILQRPLRWLDWICQYQATITWAPNFAYGLIVEQLENLSENTPHRWDLSSLKFIANGGESIVAKTTRQFLKLLIPYQLAPEVMHPGWGMSETSSGVTFSNTFLLHSTTDEQKFVEVGSPIPGCSIRIVDENDRLVAEGDTGLLQVTGLSVTSGYYENPEATQEAFTKDGWFRTGDLGFIMQGCLTITGRQKDVIVINGLNYYSHEIESVVEEIEGIEVSYTAAFGVASNETNTEQLVICFSSSISQENQLIDILKKIRQKVVTSCGVNPYYLIPVDRELIPKTSIGKIQRSQLKQSFLAGDFNLIRQQIDVLLGNANTIPNWFYHKIWQPKDNRFYYLPQQHFSSLVFVDTLGLGDFLCEELEKVNQSCIKVTIGSDFVRLNASHYSLDPENPQHYHLLLDSLTQNCQRIDRVIHLWQYTEFSSEISDLEELESSQHQGTYSLLSLVQALEKTQSEYRSLQLVWIASYSQSIAAGDKIAYEKAPVLGLIKTIPQEKHWLSCRHLDLPVTEIKVNCNYVWQELCAFDKEIEVAYRDRKRLIARLESADLTSKPPQAIPFKVGGIYLLTGGLGGIGTEIAKYLLENYQARLLLVGRTSLPENTTENIPLEHEDIIANKLQNYHYLQQLPGSVIYQAVDICNLVELQNIVEEVEFQWGAKIDGVLHLAGDLHENPLELETPESIATILRPKVSGTWVLHQLLKGYNDLLFIHFSSVNGFFGGNTVGAYAAANSFQEVFCEYQRSNSYNNSYCLASSMWDEIGMSKNYQFKNFSRAKGYCAITPKQGINSLLAVLSRPPKNVFVGLDSTKSHVRRLIVGCQALEKLTVYFTAKTAGFAQDKIQNHNLFEMTGQIEFVQLEQMPLTKNGEVDREHLAKIYGYLSTGEQKKPRNDREHWLVETFQELLNLQTVGVHDNFFELGGHSLLAVRLMSQINQQFSVDLPLATLFQNSTIEQLAIAIDSFSSGKTWSSLVLIQPKGLLTPFFCMPGAGGNVIYFHELARELGTDRPFYGLQAVGLDGETKPFLTTEEIACQYIKEIKTVQPVGPYLLGGQSFGGQVAFEIAQQLQRNEETIGCLAILDTYAPINHVNTRQDNFSQWDNAMWMCEIAPIIGELIGKNLSITYDALIDLTQIQQEYYFKQQLEMVSFLPPQSDIKLVRGFLQVYRTQSQIDYVPKNAMPVPVTLFRAQDPLSIQVLPHSKLASNKEEFSDLFQDRAWGWNQFSDAEVNVYDIPGNHITMMQGHNVKVLAQKLKKLFNASSYVRRQ